jgi:hypothetical protein
MSLGSNAFEPTPEECAGFASVSDVADWASVAPGRVRASLLDLFGLSEDDKPRVLAFIPEEAFDDTLQRWSVPKSDSGEEMCAPTPAQLAQAGLMGRAARVACGAQRRLAEVQANADMLLRIKEKEAMNSPKPHPNGQDSGGTPKACRKVKLSQVVDQTSDLEVEALTSADISAAYKRYDERLGGEPPPDHEPSADQLTGVHQLSAMGFPPYVDFSVFGPHHVRIIRKLKLVGLVMNSAGELIRTEICGPVNFNQWNSCFNVFRCACIMLGLASPAALDSYRDFVGRYAQRFSPECWALIYQADTRARRELSERVRREGAKIAASGVAYVDSAGQRYDPELPWDYIFRKLPTCFAFWKVEVEDAAILIMTKVSKNESHITGEAPISDSLSLEASTPGAMSSRGGGGGRGGRSRTRVPAKSRAYNIDSTGHHTTNRQGHQICSGFQDGSCSQNPCPHGRRHQCAVCLDNRHGANQCTKRPGKGKGSSKGKSKGKSHYQLQLTNG